MKDSDEKKNEIVALEKSTEKDEELPIPEKEAQVDQEDTLENLFEKETECEFVNLKLIFRFFLMLLFQPTIQMSSKKTLKRTIPLPILISTKQRKESTYFQTGF